MSEGQDDEPLKNLTVRVRRDTLQWLDELAAADRVTTGYPIRRSDAARKVLEQASTERAA